MKIDIKTSNYKFCRQIMFNVNKHKHNNHNKIKLINQ